MELVTGAMAGRSKQGRRWRRRGIALGLLLLPIQALPAQEPALEPALEPAPGHAPEAVALSFGQARERLGQVSDALAASDAGVRGSRELSAAARRLRVPEVSLEARYLEFQKTLDLPLGSLAPVAEAFGIESPLRFRERDRRMRPVLTAVLPLYTGGQIPAAQAAADAAVRQAEAERTDQAQTLTSELVQAYFGQILAARVLEVRREVRDGMARHLAHAQRLEEEGFATRAQRLQATVARDAAEREHAKAVNDHAAAAEALALMLRSGGPVAPSTPLFVVSAPPEPLEAFTRTALERHPQIARMRALGDQAAEGVRVQQAALKPQVFLFGQYDLYRDDALITDTDWAVGVGLRYSLFSGQARPRRVSAARAQHEQALAGLREAENRVSIGVAQAWSAMDSARRQFLQLDTNIEHARENLRLQELSFREGQSTSLDVIDARLGLGATLVEHAQAAYEYDLALARLLEMSGQSARFGDYIRIADRQVLPP